MVPFLKRIAGDSSGNTALIAAAALVPLAAAIGGGLDMGIAYMARGKLQNACDSAALAGRQAMDGSHWDQDAENEARKFFEFNFPDGTLDSTDVNFEIDQSADDENELIGTAEAKVPTTLMQIFGHDNMSVNVRCNAKRDLGHNDIVLVLDVTGSMNNSPSSGGGPKVGRLRTASMELYRALDVTDDAVTRYGIVPYSITVNVGGLLKNKDILRDQPYVWRHCDNNGNNCWWDTKWVHIEDSSWNNGNDNNGNGGPNGNGNGASGGGGGGGTGNTEGFRTSDDACIEERPTIGYDLDPFVIEDTVSRADIDEQAGNAGNEPELQFGRYDPGVQEGYSGGNGVACPAKSSNLSEYDTEDDFQAAINAATARVKGYTYHDIGMLWGTRLISRTGFFEDDNPEDWDGVPIHQHIIFLTDGTQVTNDTAYTAYGVQRYQDRVQGSGGLATRHRNRFLATCAQAKAMGVTIWVIALDSAAAGAEVQPCATSDGHYYTSDGSDLEEVFKKIGKGIGNLRLTR